MYYYKKSHSNNIHRVDDYGSVVLLNVWPTGFDAVTET